MNAKLCALLALLVLAGCSKPGARLVGKWDGTFEVPPVPADASANPMAADMAKGLAKMMMAAMKAEAEFGADGKFLLRMGGQNQAEGTWRVVEERGDTLTISFTGDNGSNNASVTFDGPDKFRMAPAGNGPLLTFVRRK